MSIVAASGYSSSLQMPAVGLVYTLQKVQHRQGVTLSLWPPTLLPHNKMLLLSGRKLIHTLVLRVVAQRLEMCQHLG
eukprot:1160347-Pelagomonas_calceolata.AAC.4